VLRAQDGQRITLSNIRPARRAFTVARRIEFYRRRSHLPRLPTSEGVQEAAAAARQQAGRLADRFRETTRRKVAGLRSLWPRRTQSRRSSEHDEASDADLLSHLLALHEADLITDTELAAKKAALGVVR